MYRSKHLLSAFLPPLKLPKANVRFCEQRERHRRGCSSVTEDDVVDSVQVGCPELYINLCNSNSQYYSNSLDEEEHLVIVDGQTNLNARENEKEAEVDESGIPMSECYVMTFKGTMHQLRFRAENVKLKILLARRRRIPDDTNDKICGPYSEAKFSEVYDLKCSHWCYYKRSFETDPDKDGQNKPIDTPLVTVQQKPPSCLSTNKKKKSISAGSKSSQSSVIYAKYGEILLRIKVPKLQVKQMREYKSHFEPSTQEVAEDESSLMGKSVSNEPSRKNARQTEEWDIEKHKNHGKVYALVNRDVIQVSFDMACVRMTRYYPSKSLGSQITEDKVWLRHRLQSTNKTIYFPLPRSTFYYVDPMIEKRRKQLNDRLHGREPYWITDAKKKRRAERSEAMNDEEVRRVYSQTDGSVLCFEADTCTVRSKTGLGKATIQDGVDLYEEIICDRQKAIERDKTKQKKKPAATNEFTTQHPKEMEVPDWNLQVHEN